MGIFCAILLTYLFLTLALWFPFCLRLQLLIVNHRSLSGSKAKQTIFQSTQDRLYSISNRQLSNNLFTESTVNSSNIYTNLYETANGLSSTASANLNSINTMNNVTNKISNKNNIGDINDTITHNYKSYYNTNNTKTKNDTMTHNYESYYNTNNIGDINDTMIHNYKSYYNKSNTKTNIIRANTISNLRTNAMYKNYYTNSVNNLSSSLPSPSDQLNEQLNPYSQPILGKFANENI